MLPLAIHRNTNETVLRVLAVLILYVCISTVAEITPLRDSSYYGLDVLTISGDRSSVEVFSVGGIYVLHDYSMLAPGCSQCRPIEFQVDQGSALSAQPSDYSVRIVPQAFEVVQSVVVDHRSYFSEPVELLSWDDDLDIPPPRQ